MEAAFKYNPSAHYKAHPGAKTPNVPLQGRLRVVVQADSGNSGFDVRLPNAHFEGYVLPQVTEAEVVERWISGDLMSFFQNQVNFAVWCATSGCGISVQDHLEAQPPLLRAVYRFHLYYTVRRILEELKVALPGDTSHDPLKSPYDRRAFERLADEFEVDRTSDWRAQEGLGIAHLKGVRRSWKQRGGYFRPQEHVESWTAPSYDPATMTFEAEKEPNRKSGMFDSTYFPPKLHHVEYVEQTQAWKGAWTQFVLPRSQGFTRAGVERLNDTIRTYVWAILGAQGQTRAGILGEDGTAFDAQKEFLSLVEDAIASPVDLGAAIARYQDVLRYAGSEVNFSFGQGLYMAPSDMELRVGKISGYNNEIVIAGPAQTLGQNDGLNSQRVQEALPTPSTKEPLPTFAGESGTSTKEPPTPSTKEPPPAHSGPEETTDAPPESPVNKLRRQVSEGLDLDAHEEQKQALVIGGVTVGLVALWFLAPHL